MADFDLLPEAPRVIGISGKIGAGKSEVAGTLSAWGFARLEFAGPFKAALMAILLADGHPRGAAHDLVYGVRKNEPCDTFCGQTMRHARQSLGTGWGRDQIGADCWAGIVERRIARELAAGRRVVVEDVRYPNEAAVIRGAHPSAEIWQITGRASAAGVAAAHCSEAFDLPDPDLILHNSGTLDALEAQVLEYILG
ncbi:hypothetical protein KUV64_21935 [Mameliella alba]|uniref:hypothetical protein n=1 Tax=Mameliella alba TaxID=561184 RepID=UPI001C937C4F|nr:hypothetical protein [Mameliella alba]MBY6121798.1 hypothetical protein [Mameliella alba]